MSQSDAIDMLMTAAAVEAVGAEMRSTTCRNCGTGMTSRFCPNCGQSITDHSKSLIRVIGDAAQDFVHFDSRVLRTLAMLLFLPGRMTRQFIDGRRTRFVPPLRLYLFSSLVFFLILSAANVALFVIDLIPARTETTSQVPDVAEKLREAGAQLRDAGLDPALADHLTGATGTAIEGVAAQRPMRFVVGNRHIELPAGTTMGLRFFVDLDTWSPQIRVSETPILTDDAPADAAVAVKGGGDFSATMDIDGIFGQAWAETVLRGVAVSLDHPENLNRVMGDNLVTTMFILMPIYAVLLGMVHFRRRMYFVDHLTFAFHMHAFLFVFLTILVLLRKLAPGAMAGMETATAANLLFGLVAVYSWVAMKRAYAQGVIKTTLKWGIVGSLYSIVLLFGLLGALMISLPEV